MLYNTGTEQSRPTLLTGNPTIEARESLFKPDTATYEIQSDIEAIEKDTGLYRETNFDSRLEAQDYIEFNIIDRIDGLLQSIDPAEELVSLREYAEDVKRQLEGIDDDLFQRLRGTIRTGGCAGPALRGLIAEYVGDDSILGQDEVGYDNLDMFIDGLLLARDLPVQTKAREPEMMYYQQTPVRIIFEMIEKAQFTGNDVFYDLGSGLGQVSILVNLVSGASAKGVEFEPAYSDYARACAADLNLPCVEFINVDARAADFSDGTVFFMYTPFAGGILQEVLEKLRREARRRRITLFSYGACTQQVAQQSWLSSADSTEDSLYKLGVFRSL